MSGIAAVLDGARAHLRRVSPADAYGEQRDGALVVDIRPQAQRVAEGEVPGALVIERNVLEWRLDPGSEAALPLARADLRVLVLCSEGYTSSLAARALQEVDVHHATDVVGGFRAWQEAGLPTVPGGTPAEAWSGSGPGTPGR